MNDNKPVIALEAIDARIAAVMIDPAIRASLKQPLDHLLKLDPADAANEAELIAGLLRERFDAVVAEAMAELRH